jgi:hypothetical protein
MGRGIARGSVRAGRMRGRPGPQDELTVFVISAGEEVLEECLAALDRQTCSFRLERIVDVYPMSAAFQAMPDRCSTKYFVQVDADMVPKPHAVEVLYERIRDSGPRTYMVSGPLWQEGFGVAGAVKCWKRAIFRLLRFRDVRTVDRDFYRRAARLGLRRTPLTEPLGIHQAHHSPYSDFLKSKGDVEKWRFLGREPQSYALPLLDELVAGLPATRLRLLGALLGALTGPETVRRSKDLRRERQAFDRVRALVDVERELAPAAFGDAMRDVFAAAYAGDGPARQELARIVAELYGAPEAREELAAAPGR